MFLRKRKPNKNQTSEDTKRRHGTWGGRGGITRDGGTKNATPPTGTGRGMSRGSRQAGGGAGVRVKEEGRGRKGPLDGRTLGPTGTWAQVKDGKGGQPKWGRQAWLARRTPLGRPS